MFNLKKKNIRMNRRVDVYTVQCALKRFMKKIIDMFENANGFHAFPLIPVITIFYHSGRKFYS